MTYWGPQYSGGGYSCMISSSRGFTKWKEPWTLRGRGKTMNEALEECLAKLTALEFGRDDLRNNA